jgi:hypothetical protein
MVEVWDGRLRAPNLMRRLSTREQELVGRLGLRNVERKRLHSGEFFEEACLAYTFGPENQQALPFLCARDQAVKFNRTLHSLYVRVIERDPCIAPFHRRLPLILGALSRSVLFPIVAHRRRKVAIRAEDVQLLVVVICLRGSNKKLLRTYRRCHQPSVSEGG